ncbi:MAG: GspE/PulE family protein [Anaerolineales bacterium]|nr:GspE/PulE family protein [Anaerolineales bacterium]
MTDQLPAAPTASGSAQDRPSIGQVLVNAEVISEATLQQALELQAQGDTRRVGTILIENGWIDPQALAMALSVHLNLPFIDLKRHRVQPEALQQVPEEMARRHRLVPMDLVDGTLAVVMEDPTDIRVIEELEAISGRSVTPMVGVSDDIQAAIDLHYKSNREIEREVATFAPTPGTAELAELTGVEPEAPDPVVRAVDLILEQAVRDRASDIHIVPDHDLVRIRTRVDGVLQETLTLPRGSHSPLLSRLKIMSGMNIAERRRSQDGQFSKVIEGEETFFRVATSNTTWGEMATLRVLGRSKLVFEMPELGLRSEDVELAQRLVRSPFGMLIVCGPTGSGKTTSLYAALNQIDTERRNVMTIEDPVEYNFNKVNQIQVNRAADVTFAAGLRGIMRLDPDVIMVGEVRDGETAEAATQAALTGHLVLTSLHANQASGSLYRLNHLGVERYLIVSAVLGVVAQRLVRKVCPHCRRSRPPNREERRLFAEELSEVPEEVFEGEGCNYCGHSGYLGRTGVFEIMLVDDDLRQIFMRAGSAAEIQAEAVRKGMITMRQDAMMKVREGITTAEEVLRNVATLT